MEPDTDDFRETLRRSADAQAILKVALFRESQAARSRLDGARQRVPAAAAVLKSPRL